MTPEEAQRRLRIALKAADKSGSNFVIIPIDAARALLGERSPPLKSGGEGDTAGFTRMSIAPRKDDTNE